jgi:ABC-2 type transport system permease protein
VLALIRKDMRQLLRDRSNISVAVVLPLLLILIFGCGVSLDVKQVSVALVMGDSSPTAVDVISGIQLSRYFTTVTTSSMREAEQLMLARKVDGVLRIQSDFTRQLAAGHASMQFLVHGTDANRARIIEGYTRSAVAQWSAEQVENGSSETGTVAIVQRHWFNETSDSRYFLVPGMIVLVMTLIGALLTALVMAREWERGTLEALFVTPVRVQEILLGKLLPYFVAGIVGLALCLLAAKFVFQVPLRGSLWVLLLGSALYLIAALGAGLLISSAVKNQFVASQLALVTSFLPALMLSGFLFDLRSLPAGVLAVSRILPATYYMEFLRTLFLAGNAWHIIFKDCAVLVFASVLLLIAAHRATRRRLD